MRPRCIDKKKQYLQLKNIYQITLWLADMGNAVHAHCVGVDVFMPLYVRVHACALGCFRLSVADVTH